MRSFHSWRHWNTNTSAAARRSEDVNLQPGLANHRHTLPPYTRAGNYTARLRRTHETKGRVVQL